jgi:small subunit ribosomal protein S7
MPRKGYIPRRESAADPKYDSVLVTRFINAIMTGGKRSIAEGHFYKAMAMAEEKSGQEAMAILKMAMNNVKPVLEVKSRRVGGANYQVPVEVPQRRARTLAIRWLVQFARERREKGMQQKIAGELMDAINSQGGAFKKKDDIYRMAQANKAFAHYRW